jgi:putative restriction endonuclease
MDSEAVAELDMILARLPARHRACLDWFRERTGQEIPWPEPLVHAEGKTFLATQAKGIYKPEWSTFALSVRQTLEGPYADREPVHRDDGTWVYEYFQENVNPAARDEEFTNVALMECLRERVPVAVMRQTKPKPGVRYKVYGLALVSAWDAGYFFLEGFSEGGRAHTRALPGGHED